MNKNLLFCIAFLFLCSCVGINFTGIEDEGNEYVWEFISIEGNDNILLRDADKTYRLALKNLNNSKIFYFGTTHKLLLPISEFFKVDSFPKLKGIVFRSAETDGKNALTLLYINIVNDFKYVKPTSEQIFELTAKALAKMKLPDFSKFFTPDVYRCTKKYFDEEGMVKKEWLKELKIRIKKYSKDQVIIMKGKDLLPNRFYLISNSGKKITIYFTKSTAFIEFTGPKIIKDKLSIFYMGFF